MTDVYQAPKSELSDAEFSQNNGSIENGITGNYNLEIGEVLSEAWARTKGAKIPINVAACIFSIIAAIIMLAIGYSFFEQIIESENSESFFSSMITSFIFGVVLTILYIPMFGGLLMMGVKRAVNAPLQVGEIFAYFPKIIPLILLVIVSNLFIQIGYFLFFIPGIYLAIAYSMSTPLVLDKDMSFWTAMETSRKAVTRKWFPMFGLIIILSIINFIAAIPLFIGLFWTMPMSLIALGIVYRNMFGVSSVSAN
ncbi:DUF975 family protein [Sessilibacter sp. MAH2]